MPRMEESEFHALALLLIFHYSRNTDNVDAQHLKRYTENTLLLSSINCPMNTQATSSWNICTACPWKIRTSPLARYSTILTP